MKTIEIFLFDGVDGMDVMGPLEVFTHATELFKDQGNTEQGYQVVFSADKAGNITLGSGMTVIANIGLGKGNNTDYFIVPGAKHVQPVIDNPALITRINKRAQRSRRIMSVCTGAFILAEAGLLSGRSCTTHWAYADHLAKQYPLVDVNTDAIYVVSGNVYTSAGITAGIDLALAMVERDYGADIAIQVARNMVLYLRRPGHQSQFSAPIELRRKAGEMFNHLHDWMLANIDIPLNVDRLAEFMAMSPRNFARLFAAETGLTPGRYVELMRIEKARELLSTTAEPIKKVASASGFHREERMRRVFIRNLGITPSQYRSHFSEDAQASFH